MIYLFGVLRRFQHCTGHITTGSWKGRGNQYIQLVGVLYCKLPTNGKQLPAFPFEAVPGIEPRPQRWEARVLPLCHHGPWSCLDHSTLFHRQPIRVVILRKCIWAIEKEENLNVIPSFKWEVYILKGMNTHIYS